MHNFINTSTKYYYDFLRISVLITTHLCSREFDFPGVHDMVLMEVPENENLHY